MSLSSKMAVQYRKTKTNKMLFNKILSKILIVTKLVIKRIKMKEERSKKFLGFSGMREKIDHPVLGSSYVHQFLVRLLF